MRAIQLFRYLDMTQPGGDRDAGQRAGELSAVHTRLILFHPDLRGGRLALPENDGNQRGSRDIKRVCYLDESQYVVDRVTLARFNSGDLGLVPPQQGRHF